MNPNELTFDVVAFAIEEDRKARVGRRQPKPRVYTQAEIDAEQARVDAMFAQFDEVVS